MVLTFGPKRVTCLEVTSMVIHFVALKMRYILWLWKVFCRT